MAQDLKNSLLLPKTDFPMRADLVKREPGRVAHWEKLDLYGKIQAARAGRPAFVLHDGPPFTNGDVHIGTALNKSLKDFVNRYKSMRGFRTPYVPGWDCHGLPIEQKVSKDIKEQNLTLTTAQFRAKCDEFSEGWIAKQTGQFKRVGVLADWKNEYKTKAPAFEADILRTFAAFVEQGLVYRSKKPVYWSIPFETALAEAEIEYKDHTSIAIWVKFAISAVEAAKFGLPTNAQSEPIYLVIWTTTPWTMPANLAIALNPDFNYQVFEIPEGPNVGLRVLIAADCIGALYKKLGITGTQEGNMTSGAPVIQCGAPVKGAKLEGLQARHPFIDRNSPIVLAKYVTTDSGTGAVHTAPGHGADDYITGVKYRLPVYCPVNGRGIYEDDADYPALRLPADLLGISTLETIEDLSAKRPSPANLAILKKLAATGSLLAKEKHPHSYPHCWRSKTPIIFRATYQWFVSFDLAPGVPLSAHESAPVTVLLTSARSRALSEITKIAQNQGWIPAWGEARIRGAVEARPDWCISRQRKWGVPIPAFYHTKFGKPLLDAGVARSIADKIEKYGSNFWYESSTQEILEGIELPSDWPAVSEIDYGQDTLDVWMDSGSTQAAVLKRGQGGTSWPADLYLEGSDQHRGWFQSSLWNSVIASGAAPYKAVLTHGFIVDKNRQKISKSSTYQKPQTAEAYINQHGADVIRLWIASQDFRDDIPVDEEILKHVSDTYRLIRNTLRFQLSNLFDFDLSMDAVPVSEMDKLNRWALHKTAVLIEDCTKAYDAYEFHRVYQLCTQFCSVTLSAVYHDKLKDRLYALGALKEDSSIVSSHLRNAAQTAIYYIFNTLVRILAPILTFTSDEAWSFFRTGREFCDDSIHLQDWPSAPSEWLNKPLAEEFEKLQESLAVANVQIEELRVSGLVGKSVQALVELPFSALPTTFVPSPKPDPEKLRLTTEFFSVSGVTFNPNATKISVFPTGSYHIANYQITQGPSKKCYRCLRELPSDDFAHKVTGFQDVCSRCLNLLHS